MENHGGPIEMCMHSSPAIQILSEAVLGPILCSGQGLGLKILSSGIKAET